MSVSWFRTAIVVLFTCVIVPGCKTPDEYKQQADEQVYDIINSKWREDFGVRTNYRISDVEPDPNAIDPNLITADVNELALAQAIAIATANNRTYQQQKESLYLQALALTLDRHDFARQWFGTFDASYLRDYDGTTDESLSYDTEFGFSQLLADGATVSVSIAQDWLRYLTGSPRDSLGSVLSASIRQPLLRGAGREVVRENLTQSERNTLYQIRAFSRFRKTFVVSVVTDYYKILQQQDTVTNEQNNYQRRLESRQRLETEAEAGRRPGFEVDQAQQDVLRAEDALVRARQRYQQLLDEFKITLAIPTDTQIELNQEELAALKEAGITDIDYSLEESVHTALARRLDLATTADQVEDAARKVRVAINNLKADMDLVATANTESTGDTNFTQFNFKNGLYGVGIETDLPFDRVEERNLYRRTLIELEQQRRQYDLDADVVKLDVRQAYRDLLEAADRYKIAINSLQLAQKRVESTSLLLEAGRLTTRDLLEAQDALLEAENSVTSALVDHVIAKLNFFQDVGILEVRPDGMWQDSQFSAAKKPPEMDANENL